MAVDFHVLDNTLKNEHSWANAGDAHDTVVGRCKHTWPGSFTHDPKAQFYLKSKKTKKQNRGKLKVNSCPEPGLQYLKHSTAMAF